MLKRLKMTVPIIKAPMAGVSTPKLAAAVCEAGGLGSIAVGASDVPGARQMILQLRKLTSRPFNVNVFVHQPVTRDSSRETAWLEALNPAFEEFSAKPPPNLNEIYTTFSQDKGMTDIFLELAPEVVSFHFGLPSKEVNSALKSRGIYLMATATNLEEARAIEDAGIDAIIAQGWEAGGHRGMFDPTVPDSCLGTVALTRLLVRNTSLPIVAAGGIMDGAGIAAMLKLGAVAAQLGTAFVACPESAADDAYRERLRGSGSHHTRFTSAISGRPARCLPNCFTALEAQLGDAVPPDYPLTYDAGKALHAAAKSKGKYGFGAHWAGQGAPMARELPAAELMRVLVSELKEAQG